MLDPDRLSESIITALESQGIEFGDTREEVGRYWQAIASAIISEITANAVVVTTVTGTAATDGLGIDTDSDGLPEGEALGDVSVTGAGTGTLS
jgi:hypothetical protein